MLIFVHYCPAGLSIYNMLACHAILRQISCSLPEPQALP